MKVWHRSALAATCLGVALCAALLAAGSAEAQIGRGDLVITISESLDPVPSGGDVTYGVAIKNTGSIRAKNVVVTIPLPAGTTFVKCTTSPTAPIGPCALSNGVVTTKFLSIAAHGTSRVNLTLRMPAVATPTIITLAVDANGDQVNDGSLSITTTVLAAGALATYLPSGRQVSLACGSVLDSTGFGTDTTLRLDASMGCASAQVGLRIAASGKTIDLNFKKIIGPSSGATAKGSAGIVVAAGKTGVTILGRSTNGTAGIEYFDWGIADEGGNSGLVIQTVRIFRARSAGLDLGSDNVAVNGSLVDKTVGTSTTTHDLPGGVGIRVTGDNVSIHNTKVRRSGRIGVWASGVDTDGNGVGITMDGNTTTSRVEDGVGIGILADGQKLKVKDTLVAGDGTLGVSTDGVVVEAAAVATVLDGVQVREVGGNGFVVAGTGTQVIRSRAENIAADGFVVTGPNSSLSNNESRAERHGYVVSGPDAVLSTNLAEGVGGDGFVVDGDRAALANNSAKSGAGHGFVLAGTLSNLNTNTAELNAGHGFLVTGAGGIYLGNRAKTNDLVGYLVEGQANTFTSNLAELSGGYEWTIGANNIDGGGNKKNGSTFSFGVGPAVQNFE